MGAIIVKKFGGSSLSTVDHIRNVTRFIKNNLDNNYKVIVVVSAMGKSTDNLLETVYAVNSKLSCSDSLSEYDKVLATGEQVSCGLLALSLLNEGLKAKSILGWQVPIITDNNHGEAIIKKVATHKILKLLDQGFVVIIAGFQGVCEDEITTLGRNSSDTTASAIAAAVGAVKCELYSDVEGVYTADPKLVSEAKLIENISYQHMLTLSSLGSKIIHNRAIEIAKEHNFPLKILSSFKATEGTLVSQHELENPLWGLTFIDDLVALTVTKTKYQKIIKWMVHNKLNFTFSFQRNNKKFFLIITEKIANMLVAASQIHYSLSSKICVISLVGNSLVSVSQILSNINILFTKESISMDYIFTYDKVITVFLPNTYLKKALNLLHSLLEPEAFIAPLSTMIEKLQLSS